MGRWRSHEADILTELLYPPPQLPTHIPKVQIRNGAILEMSELLLAHSRLFSVSQF